MTREEWKLHWRETRIEKRENRPKGSMSSRVQVRVLRLLYNYHYTEHQDAFIHLLARYKHKMPRALAAQKTKRVHSWRPEARRRAKEHMRSLVYNVNPFLTLIGKPDNFSGHYVPVPVDFGKSDE